MGGLGQRIRPTEENGLSLYRWAYFIGREIDFFMRTKTEKQKIVEELAEKLSRNTVAFFTDFRGISVSDSNILRRHLRKENAEYAVAKKTLFDRAFAKNGIVFTTKKLEGEIGIALGFGDQVAPAKILVKFAKEHETFKILAALLAGRTLGASEVLALAKLPNREVLLAQVLGAMQGPIKGLAIVLQANIRNLTSVLNKIKEQKV